MGKPKNTASAETGSEAGSPDTPSRPRSSGNTSELLRVISALRERIEKLEAREELSAAAEKELTALKETMAATEAKAAKAGPAADNGGAEGGADPKRPDPPDRPAYSPFDPTSW